MPRKKYAHPACMETKKNGMENKNPKMKPKPALKNAQRWLVIKNFFKARHTSTQPFQTMKYIGVQIPNPYNTICKKQKIVAMEIEVVHLKCKAYINSKNVTSSMFGKKASTSLLMTRMAEQTEIRQSCLTEFIISSKSM